MLRLRDLFFGIPLLQIDLTLPPASPPISRGLQRHLLSPSRGRARLGERSNAAEEPSGEEEKRRIGGGGGNLELAGHDE